ncbi:cupin domain-containing protein [Halobium salinum]|uniref:Cupin domain-containing protein n=1 Tax=Halobium salinum TaxID=1364940 RepID=A0ABD5PDU6_9EURY|nr:cupin domain-containing protein [Halobium salinum]
MKRTNLDTTGGFFDVVLENDRAQAATMTLSPGQSTGGPDNAHAESDQWLYVVAGEGQATVGGETVDLGAGDLLLVERGETHEIRNSGGEPLETLNLYVPPEY